MTFSNQKFVAKVLDSSNILPQIPDKTYKLQELTTNYRIQLRSSRSDYVSASNPKNCQSMAIHEICGLCGIGVLECIRVDIHHSVLQN